MAVLAIAMTLFACASHHASAQNPQENPQPKPLPDAVQDTQTPRAVAPTRPEQEQKEHDRSDVFAATKAPGSSRAFKQRPDEGQIKGFDFYRDPLNAKKPMQTF